MGHEHGAGHAMDLNDIDYDAFLANDRTFSDPEVIRTEPGGRVRLRLINGASATQFWIDLGALAAPCRRRRPSCTAGAWHPSPSCHGAAA